MTKLPNSVPLRVLLGGAMILVLLPSLAVAGLVLMGSIRLQRRAVEEGLHIRVRSLATIVDVEVKDMITELDVLSASPDVLGGGAQAFQTVAKRYLSRHDDWQALAVFDTTGRVRAVEGSTPESTVAALAGTLSTASSDDGFRIVFRLPAGRQPVVALAVPVGNEDDGAGSVMAILPASRFRPILTFHDARAGAKAAIIDGTGMVVAATNSAEVGRNWPYSRANAAPANGEPVITSVSTGGKRAYTVLVRSAVAPWDVAYLVPAQLVETPVMLSRLLIGALVLLLAVPVLMTLLLGRFLSRQIRVLTAVADAVAHETSPPPRAIVRLREIDAVYAALEHAAGVVQERGEERERLRAMELDLERMQRMESIGQLAASVAHDFGNYLFTIRGNLELIERAASDNERVQRLVEPALKLSHEATRLVQQMSSLARRSTSGVERVNVNLVLEEISDLLRHITGRTVRVELQPSPRLWDCRFDPQRLQSALVNLVANARDAMPSGGKIRIETRNLTLTAERAAALGAPGPGRYVALSVADDGTGMSPETMQHIFEPFFTTKAKEGGQGIGLSVLFTSVAAAGGHVTVESAEGAGTTFTILLPEAGRISGGTASSG